MFTIVLIFTFLQNRIRTFTYEEDTTAHKAFKIATVVVITMFLLATDTCGAAIMATADDCNIFLKGNSGAVGGYWFLYFTCLITGPVFGLFCCYQQIIQCRMEANTGGSSETDTGHSSETDVEQAMEA